MLLVNIQYIPGREFEALGMVKGTDILLLARMDFQYHNLKF